MQSIFNRFLRERSGNFGIMTAILMVPLLGTVGMALDVQRAFTLRQHLQQAADAAALGAVAVSSASVRSALSGTSNNEQVTTLGKEDARRLFLGELSISDQARLDDVEIELVRSGRQLTANVTFSANIPTTLLQVIGKQTFNLSGVATATNTMGSYIDFYMLLDNTPSMGVGATLADIDTMERHTSGSCAFACHDKSDSNNNYNIAKSLNVDMRIDVVREATLELTDTAASTMIMADQYRMAVYTFGAAAEDAKLTLVSSLSSDMTQVSNYASTIDLMTVPYQNYNNDQTTNFDAALKELKLAIGTGGTGNTISDREKVIFFVSDGLGDSEKPSGCTEKLTGNRCQEPIDVSFCTPVKAQGVKIAVLYTTYLPLPKNDWYNTWIKPFQSDISTRMEACASDGLFFEVAPGEGISEAMNALFNKVIGKSRLSS